MKVRNKGISNYIGTKAEIHAGDTAEVSDEVAAYLLSGDCPGDFEQVEDVRTDFDVTEGVNDNILVEGEPVVVPAGVYTQETLEAYLKDATKAHMNTIRAAVRAWLAVKE